MSNIMGRKSLWVAAAVAGCLLPGCVTASKYYALEDELARSQEELAYMRDTLGHAESLLTDNEMNQDDLARLQAELAAAQLQKQELLAEFERFRTEMGFLDTTGVEQFVNAEEGMYGYRAQGDVLFSSGSAVLTKGGKSVLSAVAERIQEVDSPIRVDGHTDIDPIKKTKAEYPHGNIQLGARRAIAVRAFLIEEGVAASRISIASFGEYRPILGGKDAQSKSKNRRVEIMLRTPKSAAAHG